MNSSRTWFRILSWSVLFTLAAISPGRAGPAALNEGAAEPAAASTRVQSSDDAPNEADRQVVLYYFHGTRRCKTCRTIEAYTNEAIQSRYAEQVASGALLWKTVNTDEPAHRHFVEDFDLLSSSLVLVEMHGDEVVRFEVLQDVWTLVRDELRFIQYVQRSVREYLQ